MSPKDPIRHLVVYSAWANQEVFEACEPVSEAELDRALEIGPGPGTLRSVLMHIWAGEATWLRRWRNEQDVPWPDESEITILPELRLRTAAVNLSQIEFINSLDESRLTSVQVYRDSKGSLFKSALLNMLLQGVTHATHHRAQAANAIRRLGHKAPELDYMMRVRQVMFDDRGAL